MKNRQHEFRVVSFEVVGQDGKGEVVASLLQQVWFAFLFIALLLQSHSCTLLGACDPLTFGKACRLQLRLPAALVLVMLTSRWFSSI